MRLCATHGGCVRLAVPNTCASQSFVHLGASCAHTAATRSWIKAAPLRGTARPALTPGSALRPTGRQARHKSHDLQICQAHLVRRDDAESGAFLDVRRPAGGEHVDAAFGVARYGFASFDRPYASQPLDSGR